MLRKPLFYILTFLGLLTLSSVSTDLAYAQVDITLNETTPCFLNYTASYNMLENCNADDDYISWILSGWVWISGGYFPMIIVSLIIGTVYIKYNEVIYTVYIGMIFLPISYVFFPDVFLSWSIIMAFVGVGVLIWYAVIRQTE